MNIKETVDFLRNNPIFWSRLGFCYDPSLYDENGDIVVFEKDFTENVRIHNAFADAGVKGHTCILHSGWVGVDTYDYSLCDRVLDSIFASGKVEYFIPRIKVNPPIEWCRENPAELLVYENGPRTEAEIKALVGTLQQDYIGYEAPDGYYIADADWKDHRPNVNSLIARQSFSSDKWLHDAEEALCRLIDRLEASPYADRIPAYHIAFGASGEAMLWGRSSGWFGDYGIVQQEKFKRFGIEKYGSEEAMYRAWGDAARDCIIPPSSLREMGDFKDPAKDVWSIDYDMFMGEVNVNAILHFADVVHRKTNKAFGTFYGYILHMERTAYTGHLAFEKLLKSGKVDFFAAPKSYRRSAPGEPGGEMAPTISVNRSSLWLDECDNRTHLAVDTIGGVAANAEETYAVQLREFCKNLSHNSGLWYMDLGGGWYNDDGIMQNIQKIAAANDRLRQKPYASVAEMTVIVDEKAVMMSPPNRTRETENFLRELQLCGAPIDIIFSYDAENVDLSRTKLAVLLTPRYLTDADTAAIRKRIAKDGRLLFVGKTEANTADDFQADERAEYPELRALVEAAGVHCLAPANCTVYADSRVVSFFPREDMTFRVELEEDLFDVMTGEKLDSAQPLAVKGKLGRAFARSQF